MTFKIECARRRACKLLTDYNQKILTFHSINDYFALLKDFNTNTLNFYQYFKDKLSSHQPFNAAHQTQKKKRKKKKKSLFKETTFGFTMCTYL